MTTDFYHLNIAAPRFFLCAVVSLFVVSTAAYAQPEEENRQYKLAQSYEVNGDVPAAARIYKELYNADPESRVYFEGLKRTWLVLGRFQELLPYVEQRVARFPKDYELRITYAEILHATGKTEEANAAWSAVLTPAPTDQGVYMLLGESYTKSRLFAQAASVYQAMRDRFGRSLIVTDRLARLYAILGEYRKAASEYGDLLALDPTHLSFVQTGMSLFTSNPAGIEAAINVIKDLAGIRKNRPEYLELLSWLYAENNQYQQAFDVAVQLDNMRNAKGSDIYAFADRTLRVGRFDAAIQAYEYFLKTFDRKNPLTPPVIYNYVYALESQYNKRGMLMPEQARELIERYREVIEYGKGGSMASQASLQIAHLQAEVLNEPREALRTLTDEIREVHSISAMNALLFRAELTLRLGQIPEAQKLYQQVCLNRTQSREATRNCQVAKLRYAETLLYINNFKEAVDSLTVLTEDVGSDAANDALAWLFILQENLDQNDAALKSFVEGKFKEVQHDWDGVVRAMNIVAERAPGSSLADNALFVKAVSQRKAKKFLEARETLLGIVENYKDGTHADQALYLAAEVSDKELGELDKAVELYTKVLVEYPYSQYVAKARDRIRELRQGS